MFGKNHLAKPVWNLKLAPKLASGDALAVNSIFATIQGEGPLAGQPAIFVRLSGCNLQCYFCDTEFESGRLMTYQEVVTEVVKLTLPSGCQTNLVVLTGGEPLRQQVIPLITFLGQLGFHTQIETAGTLWPPAAQPGLTLDNLVGKVCSIVCSPKTGKVNENVQMMCDDYKYIIREGMSLGVDGLPNSSTQDRQIEQGLWRPSNRAVRIWLQPCEEYNDGKPDAAATAVNMKLAAQLAMRYGYRLSLQLHKVVGLP